MSKGARAVVGSGSMTVLCKNSGQRDWYEGLGGIGSMADYLKKGDNGTHTSNSRHVPRRFTSWGGSGSIGGSSRKSGQWDSHN